MFFNPKGGQVKSLNGSLLRLNFDLLDGATNNRYTDCHNIKLVYLGPIAWFSMY